MMSVLLWGPVGVLLLSIEDRRVFGEELLMVLLAVGVATFLGGIGVLFVRTLHLPLPTMPARWGRLRRVWSALEEVMRLQTLTLTRALGWSAAAQFADMLAMYALAIGLGVPLHLAVLVVLVPVTYVVTLVPISLGGLGIREGATVFFLANAGVSPSDATLLALLVFTTKAFLGMLGAMTQFARPSTHTEDGSDPQ